MLDRWTDRVPPLHGGLTTLREVAASGFVEWPYQQRAQGHGVCFGIVPDGMTAAVGILQVRFDPNVSGAEWGFVLGARFESTLESSSPEGIPRDPESVFGLREHDWRHRARAPRVSSHDAAQRILKAVEAAESELRRSGAPETVEPYPLFLFDRRRRE